MNNKITALHNKALSVSTTYRQCEAELISILQELDKCGGYLHFDASSLYDYCHRILKISESASYDLIAVARKSREIPALQQAIACGDLTVSKARRITPVLNNTNQDEWLALATTSTSREIEKAVAAIRPNLTVKESVKYRSKERIELTVGVSEATLVTLERVVELESQRHSKPATKEDALAAALELYLDKNDPIRKAELKLLKNSKPSLYAPSSDEPAGCTIRSNKRGTLIKCYSQIPNGSQKQQLGTRRVQIRKALPADLIREVDLRDRRQCTHTYADGRRCNSSRWLHYHHIVPVSLGGDDTLLNLQTLCSTHHKFIHKEKMQISGGDDAVFSVKKNPSQEY